MYCNIMFLFKGKTPLMYAASGGRLEVVKYLVNNGANVNDKDKDGKFSIHYLIVTDYYFFPFDKTIHITIERQNIW